MNHLSSNGILVEPCGGGVFVNQDHRKATVNLVYLQGDATAINICLRASGCDTLRGVWADIIDLLCNVG
jgi:hypothetical protein